MRKSLLNFIGLVVAIALSIIGCNYLPLSTKSPTVNITTIKLSGWSASPAEQRLLKSVLRDFEVQHPSIKVKYEVIADQYMDVIKTRLVGEAAPDVFYLDALEAPFLMSQDVIEPLDTYIKPEFDLPDFQEALLNTFKYKNSIYGLPKDYSTLALFYNKQAFANAGLENPPTTWEELRADAKKLTKDTNNDGRIDQYGFGETPELARQAYKIKAFGGELIDSNSRANFANQQALQGLQVVVDQYQKEHSSVQKSDVGTNSGTEMFGQGKAAMVIEGNWAIPFLKETFPNLGFATAEIPKVNKKLGTMIFTVAYVMNKQSQHKPEAWELISYLTGKQGMQKWTGTGFALPTRQSVAANLGYEQDPLRSSLVAGVNYGTPWQVGKFPAAITNNFDNQFISAMLGEQTLMQAMEKAQNQANQLIKTLD
ncbi:ABC transporter substrate-binding protein [Calothrix sp. PCC 6303]|uniref:ABC transporter substrate-binding protein n=1 Tax=Calothrix sp. PCC 6303 TaxID=1170562 RepID=UPI0002A05677|nr:ABC transporter substrate-binding protein [Calothrix sp. PCC 6303]AFZ00259.1 carbohydrate ABC transporter substrate-binding protein, CUT1 family [Calothrix sp. PCC 6303]